MSTVVAVLVLLLLLILFTLRHYPEKGTPGVFCATYRYRAYSPQNAPYIGTAQMTKAPLYTDLATNPAAHRILPTVLLRLGFTYLCLRVHRFWRAEHRPLRPNQPLRLGQRQSRQLYN